MTASRRKRNRWRRNRIALLEQLEDRLLLASAWRNPLDSLDVNGDRHVRPVDALCIFNALHDRGAVQLAGFIVSCPRSPVLDVSGDGYLSPIDALLVINALNSQGSKSLRAGRRRGRCREVRDHRAGPDRGLASLYVLD